MEADDIWTWGRPRGKRVKEESRWGVGENRVVWNTRTRIWLFGRVTSASSRNFLSRIRGRGFAISSGWAVVKKKKEKNGKSRNGRKRIHTDMTRVSRFCAGEATSFLNSRVWRRVVWCDQTNSRGCKSGWDRSLVIRKHKSSRVLVVDS